VGASKRRRRRERARQALWNLSSQGRKRGINTRNYWLRVKDPKSSGDVATEETEIGTAACNSFYSVRRPGVVLMLLYMDRIPETQTSRNLFLSPSLSHTHLERESEREHKYFLPLLTNNYFCSSSINRAYAWQGVAYRWSTPLVIHQIRRLYLRIESQQISRAVWCEQHTDMPSS
jgi:hypothetical protein